MVESDRLCSVQFSDPSCIPPLTRNEPEIDNLRKKSVYLPHFENAISGKERLQAYLLQNRKSSFRFLVFCFCIKVLSCVLYVIAALLDSGESVPCATCSITNETVPSESTSGINYLMLVWVWRPVSVWVLQLLVAVVSMAQTVFLMYVHYKSLGIDISMKGDDMRSLTGRIKGPEGTLYAGGVFELDIKIPENWPHDPPKVSFVTKIFHVNISSVTGMICLNVLGSDWPASTSLEKLLQSIMGLLESPEKDDAQDHRVVSLLNENEELFNLTTLAWTARFAGGRGPIDASFASKMAKLSDKLNFNVTEDELFRQLSWSQWDVESAAYNMM